MSPRRRDAEGTAAARAQRRGELLDTAARVFAERGYAATTIREVADAAGMLAGSLYYHFESKEAMVDEILTGFLTDLWDAYDRVLAAGRDPRATLRALVEASFDTIHRHRPAVVIYQNESRHLVLGDRFGYLGDARTRFREMWVGLLEQGAAEGAFRSDLDAQLMYRFIRDSVWAAATWYDPKGRLAPHAIADQYLAMILQGVEPHPR
ncbi:TetR/AcrR family transcriptional regulator [Nocardiopsis sediminis]|uniref:TetR/AcrR family transcriptional regulator n=1 Tax=Nocardiopsis sediminis TaxID=1778267 RepID=A0ABV8FVI0_9ACTN